MIVKDQIYKLEAAAFDAVRWGEGAQVKILYLREKRRFFFKLNSNIKR